MDLRWKTPSESGLLWEHWDNEFVVFDPRSGHTHLLNEMAAVALKALDTRAFTGLELTRFLASEFSVSSDDPELERHVEQMLAHFDELGLVEPDYGLSDVPFRP
jgi:PqqD family protein of HPr-rel-A system